MEETGQAEEIISVSHLNFRTRIAAYEHPSPSPSPLKNHISRRISDHGCNALTFGGVRDATESQGKRKRDDEVTNSEDKLSALRGTRKRASLYGVTEQSPSSLKKPVRKKPKRDYAPPEVYEHLHMLPDYLDQYLDVLFCGINPGCSSAECGHHYAHPTNHFWACLYLSKLTDRLLLAEEDYTLPEKYKYGLTNLVDRPSAEQSELCREEMKAGVPTLMNKIAKYRPRIVCFLARSIWEVFIRETCRLLQPPPPANPILTPASPPLGPGTSRMITSRFFPKTNSASPEEPTPTRTESVSGKTRAVSQRNLVPKYSFTWGLQPFKVGHRQIWKVPPVVTETLFFVVPSPSARVVHYQWWDKVKQFEALRTCILDAKLAQVDTSAMHSIPLERTTSKSIYWLVPQDQ